MASWKSLLGFTERFAVIDQIASLLKLDPEVQHSQAIKSAQAIETECFNTAYSEEAYIQLWKSKLEDLKFSQTTPSLPPITAPSNARALSWVHSHDIIHRDVKPSNILLSHSGSAYLADFGIAWSPLESSEPEDAKITDVGTTAYRPPEILFGYRAYGKGLDLWSFGCTVAECFTEGEETFFDAGDLGSELKLVGSIFMKLGTPGVETWPEAEKFPDFGKILFHQFPKRSWEELLPGASEGVRDLVGKLLVYESSERISAEEVVEHEAFRTRDGEE